MQKKRAVIYCRVSTKEQVEEGNSLVTQEKNCKDYAHKNDYEVAAIFIEQGESAKTADRTELKKLLSFCALKKSDIQAVIAYKIDRISRNTDDYSQIRILLKRYGVEIKSTSEFFEDNPAGRFMENIIANVAQFDNDVRAERSIGGMRDAVRDGRYVWLAPYGYSNVKIDGKATIIPNNVAPVIRKMFEEIAKSEYSLETIRKNIVNEELVLLNKRPLSKSYFYHIIRNRLYTGWIHKFGEQHKGKFDPIISDELYCKVQSILSGKQHSHRQHLTDNPDFPLRKFIFHPSGRLLTGCWSKGRKKKYPYYMFHKQGFNIRKEQLEATFINWLNNFKISVSHFEKIYAFIMRHFESKGGDKKVEQAKLQARIYHLKERQNAILNKNIDGIISDEMCKEKLDNISLELFDLNKDFSASNDIRIEKTGILKILRTVLLEPGNVWERATLEDKIKLQWFYFPGGIEMTKNESRTSKICKLFKLKDLILPNISLVVHHSKSKSNTLNLQIPLWSVLHLDIPTDPTLEDPFFWSELEDELVELTAIVAQKPVSAAAQPQAA